jgi:glucan phosphorylase
MPLAGSADGRRSVLGLQRRLPHELHPLAAVAHNYRWSWTPDGLELFADLDASRWDAVDHNPVAPLLELCARRVDLAVRDPAFLYRVERLVARVRATRIDTDSLPASLVTGMDGQPLTIPVLLRGREVLVRVWRVDVGRPRVTAWGWSPSEGDGTGD